jgi:uncharacterized protein (TIGR02246 family)
MTDEVALIRAHIEALNVEFWYRVDHQNGDGVAELFCEDGVYSVPGGRNAGRGAIAESYVKRAARGPRVSRHVFSNLRLTIETPALARGVSMLTLWARDGEAPLALTLPVSVSDVHDTYVKGDDGVWRIQHRHITAAFRGDEPAVLPFSSDETTAPEGASHAV